MKPKRIILVRHGQSEGNVDKSIYDRVPDYKLNLTEKGREQAMKAGVEIKKIIDRESICSYISPYYRTRQTYEGIKIILKKNISQEFEDPRIREQDWGHLRSEEISNELSDKRDGYGTFFYRIQDGESGADVYDRMSTFNETMFRDFNKKDYEENVLIVSHGMAIRIFLMRWFHWSVEYFESLKNPKNCQVIVLTKGSNGKYTITSGEPEKKNGSVRNNKR